MSRKVFGAAAAALVGAVCLAALYGPALRAPASPPPQVASVAPVAPAAPEDLRGRIPAPSAPVVLAEVASTPAPAAAAMPAPEPMTAKAPEALSAAARPVPARAEAAPPPPASARAPAPDAALAMLRNSPDGVRTTSDDGVLQREPGLPAAAPVRTQTVVVQAPRVAAAPPPVPLDRMGRGNSVTISLPRKAPA
jgi:DNA polymerase-3 subunit gamma/tau